MATSIPRPQLDRKSVGMDGEGTQKALFALQDSSRASYSTAGCAQAYPSSSFDQLREEHAWAS